MQNQDKGSENHLPLCEVMMIHYSTNYKEPRSRFSTHTQYYIPTVNFSPCQQDLIETFQNEAKVKGAINNMCNDLIKMSIRKKFTIFNFLNEKKRIGLVFLHYGFRDFYVANSLQPITLT